MNLTNFFKKEIIILTQIIKLNQMSIHKTTSKGKYLNKHGVYSVLNSFPYFNRLTEFDRGPPIIWKKKKTLNFHSDSFYGKTLSPH